MFHVSVHNSLVIGWEQEEAGPVSEEVPDWSGGVAWHDAP